jgi:pimeloyl-ACP methyl ester carboxylesterase
LVLHEIGDPDGGAPWREALQAAGWDGPIVAPDLPGHAGTPPPPGGDYEMADAALFALPLIPDEGDRPVVVGVGASGWPATLLALGGRASALVLVDGLGGPPWLDARARIAATRDWLRAIAADPDAVAPPPPGGRLDPRLRHGMPLHGSRRLAERTAQSMPVPVLILESTPGAGADLAPLYKSGVTVMQIPDRSPTTVVRTLPGALAELPVRTTSGGTPGGA